ncbi:MAG: ABC transporter ATP-binding protein [Prolixibacteraceae bacterium]|jgi:molybdate transport system ATP-binding protein|nr:ABC transporter ATP-binding protein [Prolixibacteraceae bacterium]
METLLIEANFRKKLFTTQGEMILDVQFSIKKGELVSIYGPSGVGKTTILRILAGLTDADEGEVIVDGETWFNSLKKINLQARKRPVGYMFQDYALFPNMSIKENLKFAQTEQDPKHIDELLTLFDLKELQNRKPTMLSGGQQQRVALARALARKPKLLLLDEPLSAIDPAFRTKLQNEILEIQRQYGITTLLVSHDLPEVFKLSKRVIMLEAGKIVKQGDPFEVLGSKRTSGKVQFMAEVLKVESEDILKVLTLLSGNSLVKVAVRDDDEQQYQPGDKVVIITKAFNPVIQKI